MQHCGRVFFTQNNASSMKINSCISVSSSKIEEVPEGRRSVKA